LINGATSHHILQVKSFHELVSVPFHGEINAISWKRELQGDFVEIVNLLNHKENLATLEPEELLALTLTPQGLLAREMLLSDFEWLKAAGADPLINLISHYDRDDAFPFFPTDVYSFHVDRSPIPGSTFLCTYYGESSEILPNEQAEQKILIPEIRAALKKEYNGLEEDFDSFLTAHFFDLHYQAKAEAKPICCGIGNLWRLAVDSPQSQVLPCIHRAPKEKNGEKRLLLIC
jgi:hypothetical protein